MSGVTFDSYSDIAKTTAAYPIDLALIYPTLGLTGEAGEVSEKVKKLYRDKGGVLDDETRHAIALELGDVLWYLTACAGDIDFTLEDIAVMNLEKLLSRRERGVVHGNGDDR